MHFQLNYFGESRNDVPAREAEQPAMPATPPLKILNESPFINLSGSSELLPEFALRHIGPRPSDWGDMIESLGFPDLESFLQAAIPSTIRTQQPLTLPSPLTEHHTLTKLRSIMTENVVARSLIGMGYNPTLTPPVIQRGVLENPGWYTQYTPYQAEIAQGRLELLLYFQSMVCDLTGMEVANASLLDEGTAAAEAMALAYAVKGGRKKNTLAIINDCHPQTDAVVATRARAVGIDILRASPESDWRDREDVFAILLQYPSSTGQLEDPSPIIEHAHERGALVIVACDLLPMTLIKPPGELGADIVVGTSQPFGIPMGYGGPHAAFFATRDKYKRKLPGRIVGISKDSQDRPAFRLALQTREQHIRREKATSNICTAQALLANMAALYAIYHGPRGLQTIAARIHQQTVQLAQTLESWGYRLNHRHFFDTLSIPLDPSQKEEIVHKLVHLKIHVRHQDIPGIAISLNETVTDNDLDDLLTVFSPKGSTPSDETPASAPRIPANLRRESTYLDHPVFHRHHSETEMLRFIKRLESRDLSLTTSMIPLGSCTMKLNAAMEMQALSWPEVSQLHPFCPTEDAQGFQKLFNELETWLAAITGFDAVSLQPNAGSQGEYAGLLAIKAFHEANGESTRDICLIPRSAHGTNPASAIMAGYSVVPVDCDDKGNIDLAHLHHLAEEHRDRLGALMITYPSTHGVFEDTVIEVTKTIHEQGGQVYLDGANLNAQVGLCTPAEIGADVCHLNLHKTFCIPHGGGGPGVGPIGVQAHLTPYLPGHPLAPKLSASTVGPVAAAPWGSASILTISWAYIAAMGSAGLTHASAIAILNANYMAKRLQDCFPILYRGSSGLVAHECIVDLRHFQQITVEDVAKRLMDYGFHAPTISWPVAGTMMIEPTESESREELDRFCDALIQIYHEIQAVESGQVSTEDNLLKNAPHKADMIASDSWDHPYSREEAAYPLPYLRDHKFWPIAARIDNVYGDRNPMCTCEGMDQFESADKST